MQRLTLKIPAASFAAGDAFEVFSNADVAGKPAAAIDYTRPLTGARPVDYFPLGGAADPDLVREVQTPRLYFGWYRFDVRTRDELGNVTPATRSFRVFVNSGPRPVSGLKHRETTGGIPVFSFTGPAQFR